MQLDTRVDVVALCLQKGTCLVTPDGSYMTAAQFARTAWCKGKSGFSLRVPVGADYAVAVDELLKSAWLGDHQATELCEAIATALTGKPASLEMAGRRGKKPKAANPDSFKPKPAPKKIEKPKPAKVAKPKPVKVDKKCAMCGEVKPLTEFSPKSNKCKPCNAAYMREYMSKRRENAPRKCLACGVEKAISEFKSSARSARLCAECRQRRLAAREAKKLKAA